MAGPPTTSAEIPAEVAASLADQPPYRIVRPYRVRFEESAATEIMRTAIFLAWAADVAWQHSTILGFGRDWYSARGLFWLVRALRLDVLRPVRTYDLVFVTTEVSGYRRIAAHRHSDVRDPAGELLAVIEIDWVMTNEHGMPTRVPAEMLEFVADHASTFEMLKVGLPPTPPDAFEHRLTVRRRDVDPMNHVNNSVYIDYLEEALEAAGQADLINSVPRRYEIDFVAAAERGNGLVGRTWQREGGIAYRLSRDDGAEVFRATVAAIQGRSPIR